MANDPVDNRGKVYEDLHGRQLETEEEQNRHSARVILGKLFDIYPARSVLDVGCGLGTWLSVAVEMGATEIVGVDGPWLDNSHLRIPAEMVRTLDLEKPFDLGSRFDLVICLEVAEHLAQESARGFVGSLTAHADAVLFSAAIPFQGGHNHINEQWPDYWRALFLERGFEVLDFVRTKIWDDKSILWWLRQNTLLFARREFIETNAEFAQLSRQESPLSIVHPDVYQARIQLANAGVEEHKQLLSLISPGGTFAVKREPNGSITISRV